MVERSLERMVCIRVNGQELRAVAGSSLLVALLQDERFAIRRSVTGELRGPLCAMGTCHECRVEVDGSRSMRACMTECAEGMVVRTDD